MSDAEEYTASDRRAIDELSDWAPRLHAAVSEPEFIDLLEHLIRAIVRDEIAAAQAERDAVRNDPARIAAIFSLYADPRSDSDQQSATS